MSAKSRQIVLGVGLAGLLIEAVVSHPALAIDKVVLFRVATPQDEIVIGLSKDELRQMPGKDAGAITKVLNDAGALDVWQYAVRRGVSGEFEEAPLKKVRLAESAALRVEPYKTRLRVVPISEENMAEAAR